jgi:hypothetical protein
MAAAAVTEASRGAADAVLAGFPAAADSAVSLVVDVTRTAATTGRTAATSTLAQLPRDPFLPLGDPDTPGLGGTPGGGIGPLLLVLTALLAPFVLAAPRPGRRLRPACDLMRPPAFVSLLERPG